MRSDEAIRAWFAERIPDTWFADPPEVSVDSDEIVVVGSLPTAGGREDRIARFREESREERVRIAAEAERRFGRKVSWGIDTGGRRRLFTTLALPVMTRLRQSERRVLDTLIGAGVARSRSDALAWCVRLVGQHQADWLTELREALGAVERARAKGPKA
jgi:hypothetical protein